MKNWKTILGSILALIAAYLGGNYGPTVIPEPAPAPQVVVAAPPESWVATDSSGKRIVSEPLVSLAETLTDGTYNLTGVPKEAEPFQYRTVVVTSKGVVPPVPVIPPAPPVPPGPPPPPPPPVVVPGKRQVVLLYESEDKSPEVARVLNGLRNGDSAKYLLANGHEFFILDASEKDENGQPSTVIKKFKEMAGNSPLPVLIVQDLDSGELLDKKPLPSSDQAAIEIIKQTGG